MTTQPTPGAAKAARFGEDLVGFWQALPDKPLLFILLAVWVVFFQFLGNSTFGYTNTPSLFGWWLWVNTRGLEGASTWEAFNRILSADEAHVWFVPLIVLALIWWKRRELVELTKQTWSPALGVFAIALLFHLLGYMVQQTRISLFAFLLGAYGLTGLVWGRGWLRATFFPCFLLVGCIPMGNSAEYVTFPLRLLATKITTLLASGALGIDVVQNGTTIRDPSGRFEYEVAAACSGIRSLSAMFGLATIYGFMEFPRSWQRLLLMGMAFPLAVAGNVVRLLTIVVAAESFGRSAGNYVHESALFSLLPYLPVIGGLMLLGRWLRKLTFQPRPAWEETPA